MGGQSAQQTSLAFATCWQNKMFSIAWGCMPEQLLDRVSVWDSGQQTCYVIVSRVTEMCWEENLNSYFFFGVWGRARDPKAGICDFPKIKPEAMCWLTMRLREILLAEMRGKVLHTYSEGVRGVKETINQFQTCNVVSEWNLGITSS